MNYDQDLATYIKEHETYPGSIMPGTTFWGKVGTFNADFVIWSLDRTQSRTLIGLVDTGATYPMAPASILEELGIRWDRTRAYRLADGSRREFSLGWAEMELEGQTEYVRVIFGPEDAKTLLGAMALETFGLAADAKYGRLIPVDIPL